MGKGPIDTIIHKLRLEELDNYPPAAKWCSYIHIKPSYLGLIGLILASMILIFEYGSYWFTFFFGFIYPAWASYKAIETPGVEDDTQWLTYWVIFAFIHVIDKIISYFIAHIPLHNFIKFLIYWILYHPRVKGAHFLYVKVFRKILLAYEGDIDAQLEDLTKRATAKYEESKPYLEKATQAAKDEAIRRAMNYAAEQYTETHNHTSNEQKLD